MSYLGRVRASWRVLKLGIRLQNADFKQLRQDPCPHCKRKGFWFVRGDERICLVCTWGRLEPETRAKFGFGDPVIPSSNGHHP